MSGKLKIQEYMRQLKEEIKHNWKYHKGSSGFFFWSLAMWSLMLFAGATLIRLEIALPDYLVSGLVVIFGAVLFIWMCAWQSDSIKRVEELKEQQKRLQHNE